MKKVFLSLILFILVLIDVFSISLDEYMVHVGSYFVNKSDAFIDETIEIYRMFDHVPRKVHDRLGWFFTGIKADDPERFMHYYEQVRESDIPMLVEMFNRVDKFDLEDYVSNTIPNTYYVYAVLHLFVSSGDEQYLNILYSMIQEGYPVNEDKDKYLSGRSAIAKIKYFSENYPSVRESLLNSEILNSEIKDYILNTEMTVIQDESIAFVESQEEKELWDVPYVDYLY